MLHIKGVLVVENELLTSLLIERDTFRFWVEADNTAELEKMGWLGLLPYKPEMLDDYQPFGLVGSNFARRMTRLSNSWQEMGIPSWSIAKVDVFEPNELVKWHEACMPENPFDISKVVERIVSRDEQPALVWIERREPTLQEVVEAGVEDIDEWVNRLLGVSYQAGSSLGILSKRQKQLPLLFSTTIDAGGNLLPVPLLVGREIRSKNWWSRWWSEVSNGQVSYEALAMSVDYATAGIVSAAEGAVNGVGADSFKRFGVNKSVQKEIETAVFEGVRTGLRQA